MITNKRIISPEQVYAAYHQRAFSVTEKSHYSFYKTPKAKSSMFSPSSKQDKSVRASKEEILTDKERLARILKLYKKIAKIIIEKVRSQYIYDEALLKEKTSRILDRVANKMRTDKHGDVYLTVNGKVDFTGDEKQYKHYFIGKKEDFRKIFKEVSQELLSSLEGKAPEEKGKTFMLGEKSK